MWLAFLDFGSFFGSLNRQRNAKDLRSSTFKKSCAILKNGRQHSIGLVFLGFQAFASTTITKGMRKRGCLTLVSLQIPSRMIDEFCTERGYAALAIIVDDILMVNSYCPPSPTDLESHAISMEEMLIRINWNGDRLFCGDFNQEPHEAWIVTISVQFDCNVPPCNTSCSRWDGNRLIDFFVTNIRGLHIEALEHRISDHKIMQITTPLKLGATHDCRFSKGMALDKPNWLTLQRWLLLLEEASNIEQRSGWQHACSLVLQPDISNSYVDDLDHDQEMIDFTWELTMAKALTVYQTAFKLSLLLIIADGFTQQHELRRVERLAHKVQTSRLTTKRQQVDLGQSKCNIPMARRKLRNKISRADELLRQLRKENPLPQTRFKIQRMKEKLFRKSDDIDEEDILNSIHIWEDELLKLEDQDKDAAITLWKQRISKDRGYRCNWVTKKKISYYPQVLHNDQISSTKAMAVRFIKEFDDEMKQQIAMSDAERAKRIQEITEHCAPYKPQLKGRRPNMTDFCKALKRAKGGPGLDQWCSTELRQLAKIPILFREIAKEFQLWISLQKTPGILKQIKLVYSPKVSKTQMGTISVNGLRPITVFSCWWRAFSAMWLDSPRLQTLHNILPKDIACRSSHGPEVQACVADFLLSKWHFGATLDLSLCFDTIDVEMLCDGLLGDFPKDPHNWVLTKCNHWLSCERWVHFNKYVGDKLSPRIGIPQGDPASPLFLTLLLWLGYNRVEQNRPPGNLFQCIWMDDRTIICDNQHLLDTAISRWSEFAKHFHLMENLNKTQTVFRKAADLWRFLGLSSGSPTSAPSIKPL